MMRRYGRYSSWSRRGNRFSKQLDNFKKWLTPVRLAKLMFVGLVVGTLTMFGLFAWYSRDLPNPNEIQRDRGFSTQILDREGKVVLFDVYEEENRKFTPIEEIPDDLKKATVAIEDKDFYKHQGFDVLGMVRGMSRLFTRGRAQGGSTLTQQLVKNVLLTSDRSISRKLKELVLAVQIERKFSKDEILQMYLNEAPYGGTAWGISAAAQQYFAKEPKDLDLTESIILAGMPQAPSRYSPYGKDPLAYVARATAVARRMREEGFISEEQEKEVVDKLPGVSFLSEKSSIKAPHFVMYVKDQLEEMYGEEMVTGGGLKVTTSLNWELQEAAQNIVAEEIEKVVDTLAISNGASVAVDANSGEILSMVGSKDFFAEDIDGQVNVTLSLRQPGSAIKPVTYATAFAEGYWPGKTLVDVVTEFPGGNGEIYEPKNYDGEEHGPVHLREALGSSLNIPAVKLLALVGVKDNLEMAYKMGFSTLEPSKENLSRLGLSMTLGGGEVRLIEMASAYASFANGGNRVEPVSILKVEDRNGKVLFEHKAPGKKQVMDEKVAFLINNVLSDNNARLITFGANSLINIRGANVAVKTGTTNDMRDNWAVGWTKEVVVGVWVGNNDNSPMKAVASGVSGASPIWRRQMLEVIDLYGDPPFDPPSGVEQVSLDRISGYQAHDNFDSYTDWAIKGTLPTTEDPIHVMLPVCPGQPDKLATEVMVGQNNFDRKEFIILKESDPLTGDNLWQKAIDRWVAGQGDTRYHPPTEYCGQVEGLHVTISEPGNESKYDSNEVTIKAKVFSNERIEWVDLYLNGNKEWRWEEGPYEKTFTLEKGVYSLRIHARNSAGIQNEANIVFGVKVDPKEENKDPEPTPSLTVVPSLPVEAE